MVMCDLHCSWFYLVLVLVDIKCALVNKKNCIQLVDNQYMIEKPEDGLQKHIEAKGIKLVQFGNFHGKPY